MKTIEHAEGLSQRQVLSSESAVVLRRLMLLLLITALIETVMLFWGERFVPRNAGFVEVVVVVVIAYREFSAGRINRGLAVLCWGIWLGACGFGYVVAGIRTPFLYVMPAVLTTTAWVQGRRPALVMAVLTLANYVMLAFAESRGWLPPSMPRNAGDLMVVYGTIAVFATIVAVSLAESFQRLYREEQALAAALRNLNETLEQRVEERTEEYERANQSLQETVGQLESTRAELVQAEKLSALGSMVAGVSHELNTPLGNARLAVSTLRDRMQAISNSYRDGNLSRGQIAEFFQEGREVVELVGRSVDRAVDMVESFKQVAIDQTSERRRNFNLSTVIEETLLTLRPGFKKQPWQFTVEVPLDIEMDSYPGPLEQIVVNLVHNSIRHGFDGRSQGTINISAYRETATDGSAEIVLTVNDDGVGIAAANLGRVFDPFFTTRLGQGGSGIGLHIVHRIATNVLGGNIAVESTLGVGTMCTLTIPQKAPLPGTAAR
jgi:signal transduction histidine kinase